MIAGDEIPDALSELRRIVDELADMANSLAAELERTRQAWVDGEDPHCEDVCQWACKGPCGVSQ